MWPDPSSRSPRILANILSLFFAQSTRLTAFLFLHHVSFSSYISNPLSHSPFSMHILSSSLQLVPSVSLQFLLFLTSITQCLSVSRVEVWQRCESGYASRVLGPRDGDCGKILMLPTTPFTDDDNGAQPVATGAGTSSHDFLLSRSKRILLTWRKTYHKNIARKSFNKLRRFSLI